MSGPEPTWFEANQRHLMAAVGAVRQALEKYLGHGESEATEPLSSTLQPAPALESLCSTFGLSEFERRILLMCAGAELDSRFAGLFAEANQDPRRPHPTFSLALAAFDDPHWSALSPARPLRRWLLIEVAVGDALTTAPLRIQERVLHHLAGVPSLDERLAAMVKLVPAPDELAPSRRTLVEQMTALWSCAVSGSALPVIELCGDEVGEKRPAAAAAASQLGLRLHVLPAWNIPRGAAEVDTFTRLWEREAVLGGSALLIEYDEPPGGDTPSDVAAAQLVESIGGPLFVSCRTPLRLPHRARALFDVPRPSPADQGDCWRIALGRAAPALNGEVATLVSQFSLGAAAIRAAAEQAQAGSVGEPGPAGQAELELAGRLWDACRRQARPRLQGLAQRIEPSAHWDDLVLPEQQKEVLAQIAVHVRRRATVYGDWGFASKGTRGLGISALFAGPSGTGKTMAGEVLANELRLDLYRIDLSQVVSKYIGETEKNLRRVFDAAEDGAAILLFDEADALFGKRSEVKDSHDRYANIEVSYLLQRMEAYRGLSILTTNRRSALDQAFLRRIRFAVEFPFPDAPLRAEIWRRVFPCQTPTEGLNIDRLARLNAAGGHIRNIAMAAAFLACDSGQPVRMPHLLAAARQEFAKLERPLADTEVAGWV
jgi:hypothetical protein